MKKPSLPAGTGGPGPAAAGLCAATGKWPAGPQSSRFGLAASSARSIIASVEACIGAHWRRGPPAAGSQPPPGLGSVLRPARGVKVGLKEGEACLPGRFGHSHSSLSRGPPEC